MRKDELEVGYVLEFEDGRFAMVLPSIHGTCISGKNKWYPIHHFSTDLKYMGDVVKRVYGFSSPKCSSEISSEGREILWERSTKKELTIEEIETKLGYKIKIVGEK